MKILTENLKDSVSKVIQGAGFNNFIPITSMVGIKKDNNKLVLVTTDKTTTMCVPVCDIEEDINIAVDADIFSKLINKLTSENVELSIEDDSLVIVANGTYKIPVNSDENGIVEMPVPKSPDVDVDMQISLDTIKKLKRVNKSSLEDFSEKLDDQYFLSSYYCDSENTTTTNRFIATFSKKSITNTPILLPIKVVDLICLSDCDNVRRKFDNNSLELSTDDITVITTDVEDVSEYPIDSLKTILDDSFDFECSIKRKSLIDAIDRLCLFIDPYDDNELLFDFYSLENKLKITNKKDSSFEEIPFESTNTEESFKCIANAYEFISLLNSISEGTIIINYGNSNALKVSGDDTIHILSLTDGDEE